MLDRRFFTLATLIGATILFVTGAVEFSFGTVLGPLQRSSLCRYRWSRYIA
jgi:hypothetical protein